MRVEDYWDLPVVVSHYQTSPEATADLAQVLRPKLEALVPRSVRGSPMVLEPGACDGLAYRIWSDAVCIHLDSSMGMLLKANSTKPVLVRGSALAVPFADLIFDAVLMKSVLWTLTSPTQAVSEALRVLRAGGILAVIERIDAASDLQRDAVARQRRRLHAAAGVEATNIELSMSRLPLRSPTPASVESVLKCRGLVPVLGDVLDNGGRRYYLYVGRKTSDDG